MLPPTGNHVSFIFFEVLSFSVCMTSDRLWPLSPFLEKLISRFLLWVHPCPCHHAFCPHSWQLQSWWMHSIFYSISQFPILSPLLSLLILALHEFLNRNDWHLGLDNSLLWKILHIARYLILTIPSPYPLDTSSSYCQYTNLKCLKTPPNDC